MCLPDTAEIGSNIKRRTEMKVLVLGATGMLGSTVTRYLVNAGYDVSVTCRHESFKLAVDWLSKLKRIPQIITFNPVTQDIRNCPVKGFNFVINCIGIIKPAIKTVGAAATIEINSVFPHKLAAWCYGNSVACINITTDCVYSGTQGGYVETDVHDADDLYGRSKSLGEETELGMTIRTSIVGEEIHNHASLIEWVKSMKGQKVNGFSKHWWNGITTTEYAKVVDKIMASGLFSVGLFHVFSPKDVSKYNMLKLFSDKFNLGLDVMWDNKAECDRTLRTMKDLNEKLQVLPFTDQVAEM